VLYDEGFKTFYHFIKSKKNNPFIEINPDMNLGTQSPLENL
jgi:hypothetical protein